MIIFWSVLRKQVTGILTYSAILAPLILPACGAAQCGAGSGHPVRVYDLYFGRNVSGRAAVSDKEWRDFRDHVVTPALPNGYTVLDGQGAWMNPRSRTTISESTKILQVALPDAPASLAVVNRIRAAWQKRFRQYVVGMTVHSACGAFSPSEAP